MAVYVERSPFRGRQPRTAETAGGRFGSLFHQPQRDRDVNLIRAGARLCEPSCGRLSEPVWHQYINNFNCIQNLCVCRMESNTSFICNRGVDSRSHNLLSYKQPSRQPIFCRGYPKADLRYDSREFFSEPLLERFFGAVFERVT